MAEPQQKECLIEGARIIFRNFAGKEGQFNAAGMRNFGVVLTEELAEQMAADGWNVKSLMAREEEDQDTPWIKVAVNFKNRPPRVTTITGDKRTLLDEEAIEMLDVADIENVDLMLRGYDWEANGKTGTKAYLKTMFITISQDALERKYADHGN